MNTKLVTLFFCLLFLFSAVGHAAETLKIGYVNMNKAINLSNEGKRSKKFLEAQANQTKKFLQQKEVELRQKEEELKTSLMLSPEKKAEKQAEISNLRAELRKELKRAQKSFRGDEARHTGKIFNDIMTVVNQIAKEENFDLVLETSLKQTILFSKYEMHDITEKVIKAYNELQSISK